MFNIMIVDDERSVREGIKRFLSGQEGLFDEVYGASNGAEAMEILKEKEPQIVLTDINMPYMDGLEFIETLKKQKTDIQTIVLSGYDEFSYAQRAMRNGVEHYLLKPVNRKELLELLNQMKEEYFRKTRAKEEDIQERERVQKQQQLLCDRLLHVILREPIDREEWHYELELMDLWKEQAAYVVCIVNYAVLPSDEALKTVCKDYELRQLQLMKNGDEQVILLVADSKEKAGQLEQWVRKTHTEDGNNAGIKLGKVVDSISQVYHSYCMAKEDSMIQQKDFAERALKLIRTRWNDSDLTLNEIAGELYISHNYLRYLIKERTGKSFVKYVTDLRLEKAAEILKGTDMRIQDVALEVGFEDAGYFTRIFTKKYECSPSKYREKYSNFVHI